MPFTVPSRSIGTSVQQSLNSAGGTQSTSLVERSSGVAAIQGGRIGPTRQKSVGDAHTNTGCIALYRTIEPACEVQGRSAVWVAARLWLRIAGNTMLKVRHRTHVHVGIESKYGVYQLN